MKGCITINGHKVTFGEPEDTENTTYLCMDMEIATSGGDWSDAIEVAFFNHSYTGSVGDGTLRKVLYADKGKSTEITQSEEEKIEMK